MPNDRHPYDPESRRDSRNHADKKRGYQDMIPRREFQRIPRGFHCQENGENRKNIPVYKHPENIYEPRYSHDAYKR